jgi:hypothetical protein
LDDYPEDEDCYNEELARSDIEFRRSDADRERIAALPPRNPMDNPMALREGETEEQRSERLRAYWHQLYAPLRAEAEERHRKEQHRQAVMRPERLGPDGKPRRRTHAEVSRDNRTRGLLEVGAKVRRLRAHRRAHRDAVPTARDLICELSQALGPNAVAREVMRHGFRTPNGGLRWTATQVERERRRPSLRKVEDLIELPPTKSTRRNTHAYDPIRPRARGGEYHEVAGWSSDGSAAIAAARAAWFEEAYPVYMAGGQAEPEPRFDDRGRVVKERRLSRLRRR